MPKKPEQTRFSPPDAEKRRRPRGSLRRAGIMAARHRRAARGCAAGAPALAAFVSPAGNHRPTIPRWPRGAPSGFRNSGVPAELNSLVDGEVYIPMYGMIQSFNVSVAAAVILSEASRQRVQAGMYDRPSYPPDELAARLEAWIEK